MANTIGRSIPNHKTSVNKLDARNVEEPIISETEIVIMASSMLNSLTQEAAIAEAEKQGLRILTNKEVDGILQDYELINKHREAFPVWTGTIVEYKGTECKITENGHTEKITLPKEDGWYLQDRYGIPNGSPSAQKNPEARYLQRIAKEGKGLVYRDCDSQYYDEDYSKYVILGPFSLEKRGVLAKKALK